MKFDKVKIELVNKQMSEMDLSQVLGNVLWGSATTIAQNRLAQRIYDGEEVDLSEADIEWIQRSIAGKLNYATCAAVKKLLVKEEE